MPAETSKRLVIDADVFLSAGGEEASNPRAVSCRDFLQAVYVECHTVVTTPALRFEWKKMPTKKAKGRRLQDFARKWLTRMNGKKKVHYLEIPRDNELLDKIETVAANDTDKEEMLDDAHLLEAALVADGIVISCEVIVRRLFETAAVQIGQLRGLVWVNPEKEDETPVDWLQQGAPKEAWRTLGHQID